MEISAALTSLASLLIKIPDVVWSGLVASVVTLLGVRLSNKENNARLDRQLSAEAERLDRQLRAEGERLTQQLASEMQRLTLQQLHDKLQSSQERTTELRRQVFLEAAAEWSKASGSLGSLGNLDFNGGDPTQFLTNLSACLAKLSLVAEAKTALLMGDLYTSLAETTYRLLPSAVAVADVRSEIAAMESMEGSNQAERKRLLSEMGLYNQADRHEPAAFEALVRAFEHERDAGRELTEKASALGEKRNELHLTFYRRLLKETEPLIDLSTKGVLALRADLGFTAGADEYQTESRRQTERVRKSVEECALALGITTPLEASEVPRT